MNLSNYGYCLEEYEYIFDLDGSIADISYNRFNENKKPIKTIGVRKKDNTCMRSLVKFSQNNNGKEEGYLNDIVPDMKLYLDSANRHFNFDDIIVFSYGSAKIKTEDEYEISLKLNGKNIAIYEDISHISVYDKALNMVKVYGYTEDGDPDYSNHIEDVRLTDFGVITEEEAGTLYLMQLDNKVDIFRFEKTDNPIECLQYKVREIEFSDGSKVEVEYDNFDMVRRVVHGTEYLFRHETLEEDQKIYIASFHPAMIGQNYNNLQFKFGELWNLDVLTLDLHNKPTYFTRSVFFITGDKEKLNKELEVSGQHILI
ncbi:MAG: hypothetical protein NC548_15550 [Lachnospiraceae bacterium]|nr:hypothetical protein [Lachnospiraceae bacterium]